MASKFMNYETSLELDVCSPVRFICRVGETRRVTTIAVHRTDILGRSIVHHVSRLHCLHVQCAILLDGITATPHHARHPPRCRLCATCKHDMQHSSTQSCWFSVLRFRAFHFRTCVRVSASCVIIMVHPPTSHSTAQATTTRYTTHVHKTPIRHTCATQKPRRTHSYREGGRE